MPNQQDNDKNFGFTLLEMLLVITLLAGAGFVLLIKLPMNFEKQQLDLATTRLLGEIRDTRQAALAENNWYRIKFYYPTGDHYYQIFGQGTRLKNVYLNDGVRFLGSPQEIQFNATGRSITGATIVLTSPSGKQRSVIVAPVGMRIREK